MKGYEASTYGDAIAETYDDWHDPMDREAVVDCLVELAGRGGPVLELGIGTGRIALPLAARGVDVQGVDASEAMIARLRSKPGGEGIPVTLGDFADVPVEGEFPLIYVTFNTLFALVTQEDQLRCFRNVAARLAPGGLFVFDVFVPDLSRFERNQTVGLIEHDPDAVRLEASLHDPVTQTVISRHVVLTEQGTRFYPLKIRYAWPSELDLMARLGGLRLRERWSGWRREPFTAASTGHVSVYESASDGPEP